SRNPVLSGEGVCVEVPTEKRIAGFSSRKQYLDEESGITDWRIHDLRRTASTLMTRAGVSPDHVERCLGHLIGGVRGVYNRHAYIDEKREAFERLAALVRDI